MTSPSQSRSEVVAAPPTPLPWEVFEKLAELGRLDVNPDVGAALDRMTSIGCELLPGVLGISVTVRLEGEAFTFGASNSVVRGLDDAQYDGQQGPCMQALTTRAPVTVPDLAVEVRWPVWLAVARAAGVRSVLSVPVGEPARLPAAMNTYGATGRALEGGAVGAVVAALAEHAGILLANLDTYGRASRLADQLAEALLSRAVIEQAKGVLMTTLATDADTAFAYLVRLSQSGHRKLRVVASRVTADATAGHTRERSARGR